MDTFCPWEYSHSAVDNYCPSSVQWTDSTPKFLHLDCVGHCIAGHLFMFLTPQRSDIVGQAECFLGIQKRIESISEYR